MTESTVSRKQSEPAAAHSSHVQRVTERVAREIIATHRAKLTWMLHIPEWEELYRSGLEALRLPGPRKGIGLQAVLDALPLENKFALVTWAMERSRDHLPSTTGLQIDELFGSVGFSHREMDLYLTARQWFELREKTLFAMASEHRRYKNAQTALFVQFQGLVEAVVNRKVFDPAKRPDALQEGYVGLIHAIDKVDTSTASLASYARSWISRQVQNFLIGEHFAVHVPINLASRALRHGSTAEVRGGRGGGDEGGAAELDEAAEARLTAVIYERLRQPSLSIEEAVAGPGGALADEDAADPRDSADRSDLCHHIRGAIRKLTVKQREVIALRYGFGNGSGTRTLSAVSKIIGISHQQVSMREKRALQKIETALRPILAELYG